MSNHLSHLGNWNGRERKKTEQLLHYSLEGTKKKKYWKKGEQISSIREAVIYYSVDTEVDPVSCLLHVEFLVEWSKCVCVCVVGWFACHQSVCVIDYHQWLLLLLYIFWALQTTLRGKGLLVFFRSLLRTHIYAINVAWGKECGLCVCKGEREDGKKYNKDSV